MRQPRSAFLGQSVLLKAAVGLVGDAHLDQAVGQGRFEIALAEGFTVGKAQGNLGGGGGHSIQDHPYHEGDEGRGVGLEGTFLQTPWEYSA